MTNTTDKNEKVKAITEELETGIKELFNSDTFRNYLDTMSRFHHYSFGNCVLIARQCPNASQVAGFKAWNSFNRHVKKGEKAITILAPIPCKFKKEVENEKGELEEVEIKYTRFTTTSVFDISQTDGEELPTICHELNANAENFEEIFKAIEKASPVAIKFDTIESGAKGFYSHATNDITIKKDMPELQTLKTAIHEVAHSILHNEQNGEESEADRNTKEVQAESVAYTVSKYFGLDTSDYSFGYIASWSKGKELKELQKSLEAIQKTAKQIIDSMENTLKAA